MGVYRSIKRTLNETKKGKKYYYTLAHIEFEYDKWLGENKDSETTKLTNE